jgi:hypothetical protein
MRPKVSLALAFTVALWGGQAGRAQQKPELGSRFNACLDALDQTTLHDPGFKLLIGDLEHVRAYANTKWNVNKRYQSDALNVIIPKWDEEFWPGQLCGDLPREPADCVTAPKENYIVCNPALGRELGSPLVQSGIASIEEDFGSRFILLTLIGHELGHIRIRSDQETHHLVRFHEKDGMKCFKRDANSPMSEEERADEIGTSIACEALRARRDTKELPKQSDEIISLIDRLENRLDEGYFSMDDLCTGDKNYPSISRRKQYFSSKYLSCLYPSSHESVALLNQSLSEDLGDVEALLVDRQITGQVGSGNYGTKPLGSNSIVTGGPPDTYLSFDSTDTDSVLWAVLPGDKEVISFAKLFEWTKTGRLISSREDVESHRVILLEISAGDENRAPSIVRVLSKCDKIKCVATQQSARVPRGSRIFQGEGQSIALATKSGFRVLQSDQDWLSGIDDRSLRKHELNTDPDDLNIVFEKLRGMVVIVRKSGGLYNVAAFDQSGVRWKVLLTMPHTTGMLETARIIADRLLLTFYESSAIGSPELSSFRLWDCPSEPIMQHSEGNIRCVSYKAPDEIITPLALATHNLNSISDASIDPDFHCGKLIVHHGGWLWVLDRAQNTSDILPADGVVTCDESTNVMTTYRARRLDQFKLRMKPSTKSDVGLAVMNAKGPPKQ